MQERIVVLLVAFSIVLLVRRLFPRHGNRKGGCGDACGKDCPLSENCKKKTDAGPRDAL